MTRRRRRRGPPGWARAKDVLDRLLRARGVERPDDKIGRVRFIGDGISYLTYSAFCELPGDGDEVDELPLIVRLPRFECAAELVETAKREARLLKHLSRLSLPLQIPRPIAMVPADLGMAPVQTAVFGIPLDFKHEHAIEIVAEVAATVHGIDPAPLRDIVSAHSDRRAHAKNALSVFEQLEIPEAREALAWAKQHLPLPSPSRLLHGDLLGQNILRPWDPEEPPEPGLIDWEYAQIGDPAYDLAIATRASRRPFGRADGLHALVEQYNARASDQLSVTAVQLHELVLVAGFYKATADERGVDSPAAEQEHNRLRALLRRCSA